jgi:uncharacterized protein YegJ (DUF2314 family)
MTQRTSEAPRKASGDVWLEDCFASRPMWRSGVGAVAVALGAGAICLQYGACSRPVPAAATDAGVASKAPDASVATHEFARPREAVAAFAVLTKAKAAQIDAACATARATVADSRAVTFETRKVADWGMPKGAALDTMTTALTADERAALPTLGTVVLVTARSPVTRDATAARAGFAAAGALATSLHGLVYDEVLHRIEGAKTFAEHVITSPPGGLVWRDDRIAIELYEQNDGTARVLTLGMRRFGAPDIEVEGASMNAAHAMSVLVDRVAEKIVNGATLAPIALTEGDAGAAVLGDLVEAPHHEGDPDNVLLRLVPLGAHDPAAYDALVARVFGRVDGVVDAPDAPALAAIADRARASFPAVADAFARERTSGATLLVKLPFHTTALDGSTGDAGPLEWMWVSVASVSDAGIEGTLANTPVYVADLHSGSPITGRRDEVADYLLDHGDGGKVGGDSMRLLRAGAAPH